MKNLLTLVLGVILLVALFGDGGVSFDPTLSPEVTFNPSVEFSPAIDVQYAPQTTHIAQQTVIEHQTIVYPAPGAQPITIDGGRLDPNVDHSLAVLEARFKRNGGKLPFGWRWGSEQRKIDYLRNQAATWQ